MDSSIDEINRETKETIQKKLLLGVCKLIPKSNAKGAFWNCFEVVVFTETEQNTNYVSCIKCHKLMSYKLLQGSSHLSRHKCAVLTSEPSSSIDQYFNKKQKTNLPQSVMKDCQEKCVQFCSQDIRPMDIVAGSGFKNLANYLISVGSKYGEVSAENLLPHPTTIQRNMLKIADNKREVVIEHIRSFIEEELVAATTDMWTDNYKKRSYISLTLHFIEDWKLKMHNVYTGQFPIDERKTDENIRKCLKTFFVSWKIDCPQNNILSKLTWVTDQGSNIKSALEGVTGINCAAHMLSNTLKHTFDTKFLMGEDENCVTRLIINLIHTSKTLIGYMKRTGDINKLSKTLVQEIEIRRNTRLVMLVSIEEQYEEIIKLYENEPHRFNNIDRTLLQKMITFLKPFKMASDELEGDQYPTIHKVILHKAKIEKHLLSYTKEPALNCRTNDNETKLNYENIFSTLSKWALSKLEEKFKIDPIHEISCFLWPKFKSLKMVSDESKICIINKVSHALRKYELIRTEQQFTTVNKDHQVPEINQKEFEEWEDNEVDISLRSSTQEIFAYQNEVFDKNEDVLNWWKTNGARFPLMAQLARKCFSIPASSASSERSFSTAGRIIEKRRTNLKSSSVDSLMFLHDFYKSSNKNT